MCRDDLPPAADGAWVPQLHGADGLVLGEFVGSEGDIAGGVAILPGGRDLVIGHAQGAVCCVSLITGHTKWCHEDAHEPVLMDVRSSHQGDVVATSAQDHLVKLWDTERGDLLVTLEQAATVDQMSFSPDDDLLATACNDGAVSVWRVADGTRVTTFPGHGLWVTSVDWSPKGDVIASACNDGTVRVLRTTDGELVHEWVSELKPASVAWSPDGEILATAWEGGAVTLVSRDAWSEIHWLGGRVKDASCVAWSPDGRLIAGAGADNVLRIWDRTTGLELQCFDFPESFAWRLSWSPSGAFLAASLCGDVVRLWDARLAQKLAGSMTPS